MQHDLGAADTARGAGLVSGFNGKALAARRCPDKRLFRRGAAAGDLDAVCHHEGGIKADAELADELRAVLALAGLLRLFDAVHEGAGAGAGERAEIVDHFLPVHADAGIGDGQGFGILVGADADGEIAACRHEIGRIERFITQLVAGVGTVGDQLAQENIGFGIDRMHHEVQELGNLGLKGMGFSGGSCFFAHRKVPLHRFNRCDRYSAARLERKGRGVVNGVAV